MQLGHDALEGLLVWVPQAKQAVRKDQVRPELGSLRNGRGGDESARRALQDKRAENAFLLLGLHPQEPPAALPLLQYPKDSLRVADLEEDGVFEVVRLVFHAGPAAQYFAERPGGPGLAGVGFEPDMSVQGLQRAAVIAQPGAGDAEIVPGGGVRAVLLRKLLEGARGVAELARGARQGAVPGGPA